MKKLLIHATNKRTAPAPAGDLAVAARRKWFRYESQQVTDDLSNANAPLVALAARVITFTRSRERRKKVGKHGYYSSALPLSDHRGIVVTNH